MEKKQIYIISTALITFFILSILIVIFYYQYQIKDIHQTYTYKENKYIVENTISRIFFEDTFTLWNYNQIEYELEESSHKIIDGIRNMHQSPTLVTRASRDLELCAWFIWLLSEEMWWKSIPYYIWMLDQTSRTPASAWELPTAYRYFWGKTLSDFSWDFDPYKKDLWKVISTKQMKTFFLNSFSEKALFWDIGFLYNSTNYVNEIVKTWNYNSHITKNMWISKFSKRLESVKNLSHKEIIQQNFNCHTDIIDTIFPVLEWYKFLLNGKNIALIWDNFYYINENRVKLNQVEFKYLDELSFNDITLAHYFQSAAHVDGLFEMSCKWEFLPVNIIWINSRLIEKK
jgi:hypothetical protein